jgi:hypothetical protein
MLNEKELLKDMLLDMAQNRTEWQKQFKTHEEYVEALKEFKDLGEVLGKSTANDFKAWDFVDHNVMARKKLLFRDENGYDHYEWELIKY